MAPSNNKKRKLNDSTAKSEAASRKTSKREYHSSPSSSSANEDEDDFAAVDLAESDTDMPSEASATSLSGPMITQSDAASSDSDSDSSSTSTSEPTNPNKPRLPKPKSKRNDPTAFASSISAILSSKLSTTKRSDPVLARSTTAAEANASIANSKLESKARQKLREDKKSALEKGRVKDVLLGRDAGNEGADVDVGAMMEEEKRLRKTAQRGVVKLFNAVRQAQVRAEEAARDAKGVTRGRREEKVGEMSKKGFLELVAGGGASKVPKAMEGKGIEEA